MSKPNRKNLNKVPDAIRAKIHGFAGADFRVETVRHLSVEDVRQGLWHYLGVGLVGETLNLPAAVVPERTRGRYSKRNLDGQTVVRRDLPKVWQSYTWEVPNFGDASLGYHDITIHKEIFQREFKPPKGLSLTLELLDDAADAAGQVGYPVKFSVDGVLDPAQADLEAELLFHLNLLQENVGRADVFPSDTPRSAYLATLQVDWEILPVGTREELVARVAGAIPRGITAEVRAVIQARMGLLHELGPVRFVQGNSGFTRYFGAFFRDDLVAFENLTYGNAVYVLYGNWRELTQRSRLELLAGYTGDFDRVVHRPGWQEKLTRLLRRHLGERPFGGEQKAA